MWLINMITLISSLLLSSSFLMANAETYNHVQQLVYEKLDRFVQSPVTVLESMADYYRMGGFPNDLGLVDREQTIKYLASLMNTLQDTGLKPFYGLEDGTLLGFWRSGVYDFVPSLVSREPGNSAYDPLDPNFEKYWNVCVDGVSGDPETCLMGANQLYVSCVNDCELIPCEEDASIYCQNYNINFLTDSESLEAHGYIPTTFSCFNDKAEISETPGEITTNPNPTYTESGNCTFQNGDLVNRGNIFGAYAQCGANAVCSTAYVGSFSTFDYDPRWRPWYMDSKKYLQPRFSDPYLFFDLGSLGITYTHPIFKRNANTFQNGENGDIFEGVLAIDMELRDVSNFLAEIFGNTTYIVAVYEERKPYGLIGISTEASSVFKDVLIDNPNISCTKEQRNIEPAICKKEHLSIEDKEFYDRNLDNKILYKAHLAFKKATEEKEDLNFSPILEDDDDVASDSYMATEVSYNVTGSGDGDANLYWRIVVTYPLELDLDDSITDGEGEYILVSVLSGLGFFSCFLLLVLYYRRRKEQAVMYSDVGLTSAFILGCAVLNLGTFALLGEINDNSCLVRMWTFFLLSSLCLSPLFIKAFRAYRLLGSSLSKAMSVKIKPIHSWLMTLLIPILQSVILVTFTYVDPSTAVWDTSNLSLENPLKNLVCKHKTSAFFVTQAIFDILLIIIGCVLAYLTRNIDPRFGDSRALLFAMYNIAFSSLMLGIIFFTIDISNSGKYILQVIGIFWATVFSAATFVLPRLFSAKKDRAELQKKRRRMLKKMTNNMIQRREFRSSEPTSESNDNLHHDVDSLKLLLCSANVGNAPPTLESMKAWIPEKGSCNKVTSLKGHSIDREQFDFIVVGMQEATWTEKAENESTKSILAKQKLRSIAEDGNDSDDSSQASQAEKMGKTNAYLSAVEGADTVALREMMKTILGDAYELIAQEQRGQMRQYIWVLKDVSSFVTSLEISGTNTGIGNVLANKGGIVISMIYQETRITFLSAHLAAHEGEGYYKGKNTMQNNHCLLSVCLLKSNLTFSFTARCNDTYNILQYSKTFGLSQKDNIDTAISSHHMFVMGDLNFRTKFDGESSHEANVQRAGDLIAKKDWATLYSFDELHKGVKDGDLLVGFDTLPCSFPPTFKVNRTDGFDYKDQRTPSYTDRILFRSAPNLSSNLAPLAYEPCVDFITSDHKPVRGAFSMVPNQMVDAQRVGGRYRFTFSDLKCSDLLAADVEGSSDPYIVLRWDAVEMKEEGAAGFLKMTRDGSAKTQYKPKTLNPSWPEKKIDLSTLSDKIKGEATLYVCVYDYDFLQHDEILGSIQLNIQQLIKMQHGERSKILEFDRHLERYGKYGGKIQFTLEITPLVG